VIHTVQAGDTLIGIAKQYGISAEALQEANAILDPRRLQIGQELVIPREGQALERTPTSTSTPATVLPQAQFIRDITIPDKTVVSPGQAFTKTWRFRNNGAVPWGEGVKLVFVEGTYKGFESNKMDGPDFVNVPNVASGETVDVSVDLVAPMEAGRYYRSYWRLQLANGEWLENIYYAEIFVAPAGTVEAGKEGVNLSGPGGETRTMPCGSPIPPGWTCVCNCVTVPAVTCTCDGVCTCVGHTTIHYWYPC
jgi:murein DD-endopeptidase MepM/ murein hydrolase activator NlpD